MDPVSLLLGGAIALGGFIAGRASRRPKALSRPPELSKPICSCKHGLGAHDDGGRCVSQTKRERCWDVYGHPIAWENATCPCLSYDGPEPLPRSWVPFDLPSVARGEREVCAAADHPTAAELAERATDE